MARIEEQVVIAAPPEDVFDYRLDFASNLAKYNPNVRVVEQIEGSGPGVGSKYRVRAQLAPGFSPTATLTVTEAPRPQRVADRADSRFGVAEEIVSFEPVEGTNGETATKVGFVVITSPQSFVARLADALLARLSRRQVRIELDMMRRQLEATARS